MLEIRDRCNEGVNCPTAQETETQRNSAIERNFDEEFSLDIYVKNPSQQEIISTQSWIEYDNQKLKAVKIDTSNSAFDFVAPGENHFDQEKGLIKIGRSSISTETNGAELFVGNITFKVLSKSTGNAVLKFHDYKLGESGHTSVRVMEENYPVNVLESNPKEFVISLNKNGAAQNTGNNNNTNTNKIPANNNNTQNQQQQIQTAALNRPSGLRATTGNGYIFLIWDKSKNTTLKGYNLYYSTTSGRYIHRRPVGNVNQYELGNLENGKTYYLAITAYDNLNRETDYSDEVRITVGDPNSSSSPILSAPVTTGEDVNISADLSDSHDLDKECLDNVPEQPDCGPEVFWAIALIAF